MWQGIQWMMQMWQGSQSDSSSNDSDESESASSNLQMSPENQPVPSPNRESQNRPGQDLLIVRRTENGGTKFRLEHIEPYKNIAVPLYNASIRCDWKAAEAILAKNPNMNLLRQSITENGDTALHIAASAKAPKKKVNKFVRKLVEIMSQEDLELVNNNHSTALYLAAVAGNIKTVEIMMDKNSNLDTIPGGGRERLMPLYAAVLFGNKDVAEYLYESSDDLGKVGLEDITVDWNVWNVRNCEVVWNDTNRDQLLKKCVESDMFDIAKKIVEKHSSLGWELFGPLARKPKAFNEKKSSNTESNIITRIIKPVSAFFGCTAGTPVEENGTPVEENGTHVEENDALTLLRTIWKDAVAWNVLDHELEGPSDLIKPGSGRIVQSIQLKELIFKHLDNLVEETQTLERGTLEVPKVLHDLVSKNIVSLHAKTQRLIKQENTTDEDQALDLQELISEYIVKLHDETRNFVDEAKRRAERADRARNRRDYFRMDFLSMTSDWFETWSPDMVDQLAEIHLKQIKEYISEMRAKTETLSQNLDTFSHSSRVMFIAAEVGNTNFLLELIRRQPDLIWKVDDNNQTIFHVAVKHRREGIYNLLYEIGSMKDIVTPLIDNEGNNMLHLAAMRTSKKNLEDVSGAALQMQRELLWFKEVERMVPLYLRDSKNKDGLTPRELFTIEHQDLIEKGENWMKHTASQCMVVATLIATIVFAAAFTVPGGYHENKGTPIFKWKVSFVIFVVADAISLFLSSASILTFLSILTSRYAERDFVAALPMKLMLGLVTLFLSIGTMMVTFSVSFFVLYHKEMKWIPIFISGFAVIPAILYVVLQFHLLVDVVRSTYGGKYLFKPKNQVLFYKNPRF